jgi:hypothetical protein
MATRGIIAHATNNGWRGRYVHWDNYPERIIHALGELVERDGRAVVVNTLCYEHPSWSQIEPLAKRGEPNLYEQHLLVEGYGYVHTDIELNDPSAWFTHEDKDLAWCDYLYIIHEDYLEVRTISRDTETSTDITSAHSTHAWWSIAMKGITAQ